MIVNCKIHFQPDDPNDEVEFVFAGDDDVHDDEEEDPADDDSVVFGR